MRGRLILFANHASKVPKYLKYQKGRFKIKVFCKDVDMNYYQYRLETSFRKFYTCQNKLKTKIMLQPEINMGYGYF